LAAALLTQISVVEAPHLLHKKRVLPSSALSLLSFSPSLHELACMPSRSLLASDGLPDRHSRGSKVKVKMTASSGGCSLCALHPLISFAASINYYLVTLNMRTSLRLSRIPRAIRPQPRALRAYAKISPDTPPPQAPYEVFDEPSKWRQRDRALTRLREVPAGTEIDEDGRGDTTVVDYLREELADRLSERVEVS